jgi:hypothetical protein
VSQESRRRQRQTGQVPGTGPTANRPTTGAGSAPPTRSSGPGGTERAGRRERARPLTEASFFQRYRRLLVAAAVVAVVAVVGAGLVSSVTKAAYECSSVWVPDPTPAPAEGASPQPGYVQPDMGHVHVANGTQIKYTYCPPASGRHFNNPGTGPIRAQVYGPDDAVIPPGWVHNLEHGALVILYRDATADQTALKALFAAVPSSPVCGFEPGGQSPGPVVARFKDMAWPYAALVWDRVLPMETLDQQAVLDLYATFGERTNPEDLCPGARESASPSASAAPSSSAAPSGGASPSAAPSAAAPSAPSESGSPSAPASASPS